MFLPKLLYQWAPLFKLAQRGGMEPHILGIWVYLLLKNTESLTFTTPHFPYLLIKATVNRHAKEIEIYDQIIDHQPSTSIARFILASVSSLPKKAEISNIPGPLPSPTSVRRHAFITLPSLYSFCSTHAWTIFS